MMIKRLLTLVVFVFGAATWGACSSDATKGPVDGGGTKVDARIGERPDAMVGPVVCNFTNCDGCCDGNVCNKEATATKCGLSGQACQTCQSADKCFAGSCAPPTTDCTGCGGCCSGGTQCLAGDVASACGNSGDACVACPDGETCNASGACETIACDATSCPNGCCSATGECIVDALQTTSACGAGGAACSVCSAVAIDCVAGLCIEDQPCLDYCTTGCCNASGQCLQYTDQTPSLCGTTGTCLACSGTDSCVAGVCSPDPAWVLSIRSAVVSSTNAAGLDWDRFVFGNRTLPDPYVTGALSTDVVPDWFTATIDNTITPNWQDETVGTYLQSDLIATGLGFGVRDSDVGVYETIGLCAITITLADLQSGSMTFPCGSLVTNLTIGFTAQ